MTEPLAPGGWVGILGGGQLGRMLAIAAARLGLHCHILCPEADPPAGKVAAKVTTAAYDDGPALDAFAASVDVATYEFENIPLATARRVGAIRPLYPDARALEVSQDRLDEKIFLNSVGAPTAPFADAPDRATLDALPFPEPLILKTRRMGYDGKGQARVISPADRDAGWAAMAGAPAIAEGFVPFQREISVIVARGRDGQTICYDPGENVHRDGILHTTTLPAAISRARTQEAVLLAGRIVNALAYVGVMGV
jgi:5-(carboxyamino)imidazole ribonucleotide synthase